MQLSTASSDRAAAPRVTPRFLSLPSTPTLSVASGLLLAVASASLAALRHFDGLYGQDAYAYFDYSVTSVRASLIHFAPLEPFFWPPGYPLLVALASLVVGPAALAGQAVSLLAGALVPIFTAALVLELWPDDRPLAFLAASIVAVCGQLWQSSIVVMADTTGLALGTFAAFATVRYTRGDGGTGAWLVGAAAAIAYATLARWIYGLVALPLAAFVLLRMRPRALHVAAALVIGGLIVLPVVGPSLVGLLTHPDTPAAFAGNFQVYSWSPLNALRHDFFTADGHLQYALPNGLYYAIAPANPAFMGPILAAWMLVGLITAKAWPRSNAILLVGWAAIVYAFHAGAPWQNFRFALAYLPPLAILSAAGALFAWRHLRATPRSLVAVVTAIGLLTTSAAAVRLVQGFIDRKDEELGLVTWVDSQAPPAAELLTFGPTLAFRHYSNLPTFDLYESSPTEVTEIISRPVTPLLLIDEASIESQWLGQWPSENFHRLRDGPGLTLLGMNGPYSLYRVGPTSP